MTELRQREHRQRNPQYLAWLRKQPCACGCNRPAPSDAAHIRSGSLKYEKEYPGLQRKPDDKWAVPLNRSCHLRQHAYGDELVWWNFQGVINVFALVFRYNARYLQTTGKTADAPIAVRVSKPRLTSKRQRTATAGPARPKAKIASRPNHWPTKGSQKIHNRGFRK